MKGVLDLGGPGVVSAAVERGAAFFGFGGGDGAAGFAYLAVGVLAVPMSTGVSVAG